MTKSLDIWTQLSIVRCRSERDVESKLVRPLLRELAWPEAEIHEDVPVTFRVGRRAATGRKPAADIVLAPPDPSPPERAWMVIEAKKPTESLQGAEDQAESYAMGLRAALFVATNGLILQVWQVRPFDHSRLVAEVRREDLPRARLELHELLSRDRVLAYVHQAGLLPLTTTGLDVTRYGRALVSGLRRVSLENRQIRPLVASGDCDTVEWPTNLRRGSQIQLFGLAGRGKTTCLSLALLHLATPSNVPVLISLRHARATSLAELVLQEISAHVPDVATARDVQDWIETSSPVICIDDWSLASVEVQESLRRELTSPALKTATLVVAATSWRDQLIGFEQFSVGPYSADERDHLVARRLQELGARSSQPITLWSRVPRHFQSLLCEPVLLAQALHYLRISRTARPTFPFALSSLLDELFSGVVERRRRRAPTTSDTVLCAFELAIRASYPMHLSNVSAALHHFGSSADAGAITDDLIDAGILVRLRRGVYEFSHDIWRIHLDVRYHVREFMEGEDLAGWISNYDQSNKHLAAMLMASAVVDPCAQRRLLQALLNTDIVSYLHALRARASTTPDVVRAKREHHELEEILLGTTELIHRCFEGIRREFSPWHGSEHLGGPFGVGIHGRVTDESISYSLGLVPGDDRVCDSRKDLIYAPTGHLISIGGIDIRRDSGRLVAARDVLRQLKEVVSAGRLPGLHWIATERARSLIFELACHHVWPGDWQATNARKVISWVHRESRKHTRKGRVFAGFISVFERIWSADYILRVMADLVQIGRGDVLFGDMGLPGPDLEVTRAAPFQDFYSPKRREQRVMALYNATIETYRQLSESIFPNVSHTFLLGDGAIRAVIYIEPDRPGWTAWWEPVMSWQETALVERKTPDLDALHQHMQHAYARFGRDSSRAAITWHAGSWAPLHPEVTETVGRLLKADFARLSSIIGLETDGE